MVQVFHHRPHNKSSTTWWINKRIDNTKDDNKALPQAKTYKITHFPHREGRGKSDQTKLLAYLQL